MDRKRAPPSGDAGKTQNSAGSLPADVIVPATADGLSPLEYMLKVMRDDDEDPLRRDRMAMAAAPFVHVRVAETRPGKKEEAAKTATKAAVGRFGVRTGPPALKVVVA